MHKFLAILFILSAGTVTQAQDKISIQLTVTDGQKPLSGASVELRQAKDSSLVKLQLSDEKGITVFKDMPLSSAYFCRISYIGFQPYFTEVIDFTGSQYIKEIAVSLKPSEKGIMTGVTVTARRALIEQKPGKTIVNLEAGITTEGTSALEALEQLPGITIDRDGNISLKGRPGVTVLIDGKPVYVTANELSTLLSGMSASQISQVEIMDNPPARYEAAGNAGLINIITKKNKQKGFQGSLTTAYTQGVYPRNNNNIQLSFKSGFWNFFTGYSTNISRNFTNIYALRTYYKANTNEVSSMLEQPSRLKGRNQTHNVRAGAEFSPNKNTSVGFSFNGLILDRKGNGNSEALWLSKERITDSLISTSSSSYNHWLNGGFNINLRRSLSDKRQITADVDAIKYEIEGSQFFQNTAIFPRTYSEASRSEIPSAIDIYSGRIDYTEKLKHWSFETGLRTSYIKTNNKVDFEYWDGADWNTDYGKTNHFLYNEHIQAAYASAESRIKKWVLQGGIRYEYTSYDAHQLGNARVKDSSFSMSYHSLFPTVLATYTLDSINTFSFNTGRRIDRPPFQKLNPFTYIINKYTYQRGNPYYRPQYTWNIGLSHTYKGILTTNLSYSHTRDYFSQIFPIEDNGIITYTEGNLGSLQILGASINIQKAPVKWWNIAAQTTLNHKILKGVVLEKSYDTKITQLLLNITNQFRLNKGWSAELIGTLTTRSQHDIQEVLDPSGQVSVGVSKTILKGKGNLKLSGRDLFYTQWMKGMTYFKDATEYFKLTRDTRSATLAFTWRFGKAFKETKRTHSAASEEIQRVGNG